MKFKEMNLPNKLTTIRMFLVPVVIILFLLYSLNKYEVLSCDIYLYENGTNNFSLLQLLIILFFAIASITDFVDGKIARSRNLVSDYGKLMDPLADKLLVNSTIVCLLISSMLTLNGNYNVWNLIVMIALVVSLARDTFVDALRMQALKKNAVVPANFWGKLKTATLMPGIVVAMFGSIHLIIYIAGLCLLFLGSLFSIIGGITYYLMLRKYIEE